MARIFPYNLNLGQSGQKGRSIAVGRLGGGGCASPVVGDKSLGGA
jgi:hypothetical protein